MADDAGLGRRIRERRVARRLSLRTVAELAGLSEGHLSRIERGLRPVDRRSTLEAIAAALRVSPVDLSNGWHIATSEPDADAYSALVALRVALADNALGDPAVTDARPWPVLASELQRVNRVLRPASDYPGLGETLPDLIAELHVAAAGPHRELALRGLMDAYTAAGFTAKHLGDPGSAQVAAMHAQAVAAALDDPTEVGRAAWLLAQAVSAPARARTLTVAQRAANELATHLDEPGAAEVYGMLHLTASLAAAALRQDGTAAAHLAEADATAQRVGDVSSFGNMWFGNVNLGIWRVTLAVEAGNGGKAAELAAGVDPTRVPSRPRQAAFYTDLGRGLAAERRTRPHAVAMLRRAEELAPLSVRANPYVRETVTDLMRRAARDAAGAELRGLAYRMGIAV